MAWDPYQAGASVGTEGSEGLILIDEEHPAGARATLESVDGRSYSHAVTCGLYGWMVHTCFFGTEQEAQAAFVQIKRSLEEILALLAGATGNDPADCPEAVDAMKRLVDRF